MTCNHIWVQTLGFTELYTDCSICGIKYEDHLKEEQKRSKIIICSSRSNDCDFWERSYEESTAISLTASDIRDAWEKFYKRYSPFEPMKYIISQKVYGSLLSIMSTDQNDKYSDHMIDSFRYMNQFVISEYLPEDEDSISIRGLDLNEVYIDESDE